MDRPHTFVAKLGDRYEIHKEHSGNFNYILCSVRRRPNREERKTMTQTERVEGVPCPPERVTFRGDREVVYTVYTKDESCGRGEYLEEIDIALPKGMFRHWKKVVTEMAEAILKAEYDPSLRVAKVVERFGIYW